MAKLITDGSAPNANTTIDGKFKRMILKEGGYVPTSSTDPNGEIGEYSFDSGYMYIKIAAATWRRIAHSSF